MNKPISEDIEAVIKICQQRKTRPCVFTGELY